MNRTAVYSVIGGVFVAASVVLLVFAIRAHERYGKAHRAGDAVGVEAAEAARPPAAHVPPERFYRRAQWLTFGVCALAAAALLAAARTRHLVWLGCFIVCGALAAIAVIRTGVRY